MDINLISRLYNNSLQYIEKLLSYCDRVIRRCANLSMIMNDGYEARSALCYRFKFTVASIVCSLAFLTFSLMTDVSAQGPCEPAMSNATIAPPDENVLPPEMYMVYRDDAYLGELSQSKYREGETFSDLDILPENISSQLPAESIEVENGSCIQFIIRGTPSTLPPDSLDVSAYAAANGTSLGVLDATEDNTSTFRVNLPNGMYIFLATATWIPSTEDEDVTGYVIYKFLANVT